MASFCCSCPSESMPVLMLLTKCLKYLPHETSEDYRKLVFVVEHMVEAYIVVLKSLAGEKLLIAEVQLHAVEFLGTVLSLLTCLQWHSGGYEPIIELSRRLCSVQKDLGLQWEPGLSTIMASLFTILVQSELKHEQISISKLLLLILKWKYDKALRYHLKKIRDQKIIPRLRLSRAGHPPKLERFSHYVARQMGFKDRRIGPDICRLASEYISKYEGFEDDIYAYFENGPDADSLYVKLVEEFERCILSYFGFHWNHCDILISQVLSSDISEPKKKLKNIVMAATRFYSLHMDQRFERVAKSLKVASVFNTLVEEMKAMGIAVNDDSQCTHSDRSSVLLLMGGGMGAGKSTVLKDILKEPFWAGASGNAVVIEADAFKESDVIYRALRSTAFVDVSPEETVQKNAFERFKDVDESSSFKEARALAEASQNGAPFNQGFGNSPGSLSARKIEEAEAQCALLNSESLCDGCFSSDSDIFLFGARTVYREICLGDGGYVVCYKMAEIENKLGLGRDSLIALSLLLGSDYHQGVHGLGPELACQIVKSIGEKDVLKKFASEGLGWVKKRKGIYTLVISILHFSSILQLFLIIFSIFFVYAGAKNNIGKDDTILQVIDAYLKPKCHSADSDFVLKAHSQYPFQRTKLHHICDVYFEWPSERTGNGGIRISFDIGIGSGSFATVMAERNVTVITSTLN
ncbi:hypothetical protein RYX36_009698, partial [Vicia faba]